ncbi:MAG: hypothetical protein A2496_05290 [Burkholderiales bacterium RIFOXYC12_FULL_60_6]|nr:MAG: hypothetical protein A2496_05290 [Burkholderiales bacterium RIFOXYC12_FULL_60_6]
MPTVTYTGPDELSPPIATGQAQSMRFPRDLEVEVSEQIAEQVRKQRQENEFIISPEKETPAAPQPATKKR